MDSAIKVKIGAQDSTAAAFNSVENRMRVMGNAANVVNASLARIGGALTIGALAGVGRAALNAADEIKDMSDRLGISTEALSQYQHVAKMSGADFDSLTTAIKYSERTISEAAAGSKQATDALADVGLAARDLAAMSPETAFERIGDAIGKLPSASDRTAAAMKLFGRSGTDLIPVFQDGAEGVRALREEADRLGLTLDRISADKAAAANDALDKMGGAFKALAREISVEAAPALEGFANRVTEALAAGNMREAFREAWKATADAPPEVAAEFRRIFYDAADPDLGKAAAVRYWRGFADASRKMQEQGLFGAGASPLLPGLTGEGRAATVAHLMETGNQIAAGLKVIQTATDGLTASERQYFQALERSVAAAQQRAAGASAYDSGLVDLVPTDEEERQAKLDAVAEHYRAVAKVTEELEATRVREVELERQSKLTWRMMYEGIDMVEDQLSKNLAAAIMGAKRQLLDLGSIAESILSMALQFAIRAGVNAILPGAGAAPIPGMQGPTPSGVPLGKALGAIPGPGGAGGVTINGGVTLAVKGSIDPSDRLTIRRTATAVYDELLKISKHHGPMPARG